MPPKKKPETAIKVKEEYSYYFDIDEPNFERLKKVYFERRVATGTNAELPNGMRLRRIHGEIPLRHQYINLWEYLQPLKRKSEAASTPKWQKTQFNHILYDYLVRLERSEIFHETLTPNPPGFESIPELVDLTEEELKKNIIDLFDDEDEDEDDVDIECVQKAPPAVVKKEKGVVDDICGDDSREENEIEAIYKSNELMSICTTLELLTDNLFSTS